MVVSSADEILGHAHAIEGTVVHGEERGRTIGFPTANLGSMIDGYIPVDGVYAGWLIDLGAAGSAPPTPTRTPSRRQQRQRQCLGDSARV